MKYHVLTMTHKFDEHNGRFSILANNDGSLLMWIMEREWKHNQQNVSCIPRDEYILEPHSGTKYQDTFALIGDGVGHYKDEGKPRFACVIHKAVFPYSLKGCLAPAKSIGPVTQAFESYEATETLISYLSHHTTDRQRVKILMTQ